MPAMAEIIHSNMSAIINGDGAFHHFCLRKLWTMPVMMLIAMKARHPKKKVAKVTSKLVSIHLCADAMLTLPTPPIDVA